MLTEARYTTTPARPRATRRRPLAGAAFAMLVFADICFDLYDAEQNTIGGATVDPGSYRANVNKRSQSAHATSLCCGCLCCTLQVLFGAFMTILFTQIQDPVTFAILASVTTVDMLSRTRDRLKVVSAACCVHVCFVCCRLLTLAYSVCALRVCFFIPPDHGGRV